MKEYDPQVKVKMKEIASEKYLYELLNTIGKAIDEIEQNGIFCSIMTQKHLYDLWNDIQRYDGVTFEWNK